MSHSDTNAPTASAATPPVATYSILCSHFIGKRRAIRVITSGIPWPEAKALSEKLQDRERIRKGDRYSTWTCRVYTPERQGSAVERNRLNPRRSRNSGSAKKTSRDPDGTPTRNRSNIP